MREAPVGWPEWQREQHYTSHVAGMIYAREMQQGLGGTALMREKFREVSREWHQFFDFGQEGAGRDGVRGGATAAAHQPRQRNKFESSRQNVRLRRLEALRQVDISAMLRCIKGKAGTFRPGQRKAISAIVRGESPVVQITPTGGGKSMSFMLPAYCSQQGRTIVIALWGVQRVFLTATLRPSEEREFFTRAHIDAGSVVMFRGQTTRRNIRYRVVFVGGEWTKGGDQHKAQEEAEDKKAMEIAQHWVEENKEGRVIIYASTIPRTKKLAEALGVDAYYNARNRRGATHR